MTNSEKESTEKQPKTEIKFKVDIVQTLFISMGFLSAMIAWGYYNFKIPIILNGIKDSITGEYTRVGLLGTDPIMEIVGGALMTLDNIIAILLQPYFGSLSDKLKSKYGRRAPFFIIGAPTAAFCLFILPFTGILGLFIAVILVFNLAMAFYRPPVMSLMPDRTPPQIRSSANSYISLMGGLGFVISMFIPTVVELIPGTEPITAINNDISSQNFFWQDFWGFLITGICLLVCLAVFLWKVKDTPTGNKFWEISEYPIKVDVYSQKITELTEEEKNKFKSKEKAGMWDDWNIIRKDEEKSAFWILFTVFAYLFGFNAIEYSFGRYATSYLGISEGTAGLLVAIMPVMLIVFAIPAGKWAEKYGRLKIMKIGLVVMIISTSILIIVMPLIRNVLYTNSSLSQMVILSPAMLLLSIAGVGYGLSHINALPVVWQLAPPQKIGAYTGVYYMISALGSILSPLFMSSIYALISSLGGDQWVALFPYFMTGCIVGLFFIQKVKKGDAVPLSKEELAQLRSEYMDAD